MVTKKYLDLSEASEFVGKSKETLRRWDREGKLPAVREPMSNYRLYDKSLLESLFPNNVVTVDNFVAPNYNYNVLELFAGAGGLAVGLEKAGIKCVALNEIDNYACNTLRKNRPDWTVLEGDIRNYNFLDYNNKVDVVSGGFP